MKKITLLSFFMLAFIGLSAQTNLVVNPGFETWGATMPDPWYIVSTAVTGVTPAADVATVFEGTKSIKIDATAASGTYNVSQVINIVPGGQYALTAHYNVTAGDGTDVRLWCNFKKDAVTFFTEAELVATGLYATLRSGNTSSAGTSYLTNGTGWQTLTFNFTAPTNAVAFDFQFRTYKTAVSYWDGMSLVGPVPAGFNDAKANKLNTWVKNGEIQFNASQGATVEVYNAIGKKLFSQPTVEGLNKLKVNNKGVTIIKVADRAGKVIL